MRRALHVNRWLVSCSANPPNRSLEISMIAMHSHLYTDTHIKAIIRGDQNSRLYSCSQPSLRHL